jgi:hypothetical protein
MKITKIKKINKIYINNNNQILIIFNSIKMIIKGIFNIFNINKVMDRNLFMY